MRALRLQTVAALGLAAFYWAAPLQAPAETVLLNFGSTGSLRATSAGDGGENPSARLLEDKSGNLYGTAPLGGRSGDPFGTVFELTQNGGSWKETVLYSFDLRSGGFPVSGVIRGKNGLLYGAAELACGLVYQLAQTNGRWVETTLHTFEGTDGCGPDSELVRDSSGNLYGVTAGGGANNAGAVYEISGSKYAVIYNFTGGTDGDNARGLSMDSSGALFGTTAFGGDNDDGTVFQLVQNGGTWSESVLHSFGGGGDGFGGPEGAPVEDSVGNLYGITSYGGQYGAGSVFELSESGGTWTEQTLYSFTGGVDGNRPVGGLTLASGILYGATFSGGSAGGGTVFKLTQSGGAWIETVVYNFPTSDPQDGSNPAARPIIDKSGALLGTTDAGGQFGEGSAYRIAHP
ncbi:MAG TPA: choice-of-anchor tandem repeat GloVer-containing protein [Rhizomicrobium sp.]